MMNVLHLDENEINFVMFEIESAILELALCQDSQNLKTAKIILSKLKNLKPNYEH